MALPWEWLRDWVLFYSKHEQTKMDAIQGFGNSGRAAYP
jgi:hypothetical protein